MTQFVPAPQVAAQEPNSLPALFGPGALPLQPTVELAFESVAAHRSPPSDWPALPPLALPPVVAAPPEPDLPPVVDAPPVEPCEPPVDDASPRLLFTAFTGASEPHATAVETQRARPAVNRRKFMVQKHMRRRPIGQPEDPSHAPAA
jgi:hypothetical protein